jgi:hypothetical protein
VPHPRRIVRVAIGFGVHPGKQRPQHLSRFPA